MDTIERDYRCPYRWIEDGMGVRCELPDAHEHFVHVGTEPAGATYISYESLARDFDFDD